MIHSGRRIIPARAGFTLDARRHPPADRDHPRSRGVYRARQIGRVSAQGSSPLARGLQREPRKILLEVRIIPARAGFTRIPGGVILRETDHPRSRGVYLACLNESGLDLGSSPLARGLRVNIKRKTREIRIIPARAGFTNDAGFDTGDARDHPRSRGVYSLYQAAQRGDAGSSPLARGLPATGAIPGETLGIIPARAGFTLSSRTPENRWEDHPRSRGVYSTWASVAMMHAGSSPLARGLPVRDLDLAFPQRIIPARAGFTSDDAAKKLADQDHPRSRGVYICGSRRGPSQIGSSPLARGLRRRMSASA